MDYRKSYLKTIAKEIENWGDFFAEEVINSVEDYLSKHPETSLSGDFDEDLDKVCDWIGY